MAALEGGAAAVATVGPEFRAKEFKFTPRSFLSLGIGTFRTVPCHCMPRAPGTEHRRIVSCSIYPFSAANDETPALTFMAE